MRRFVGIAILVLALALAGGVALAQMGGGPPAGMMGPGMMGGAGGPAGCPSMTATGPSGAQISEDQAKELAQQYANKYLKGFAVDKVLPFTGMHMPMYSVELKGPNDEVRVLHINPWGQVMPFGGPWRRAG